MMQTINNTNNLNMEGAVVCPTRVVTMRASIIPAGLPIAGVSMFACLSTIMGNDPSGD
jgi:hypothetical protein